MRGALALVCLILFAIIVLLWRISGWMGGRGGVP